MTKGKLKQTAIKYKHGILFSLNSTFAGYQKLLPDRRMHRLKIYWEALQVLPPSQPSEIGVGLSSVQKCHETVQAC